MTALSIGTETNGSIVCPSTTNGIVSSKTTATLTVGSISGYAVGDVITGGTSGATATIT